MESGKVVNYGGLQVFLKNFFSQLALVSATFVSALLIDSQVNQIVSWEYKLQPKTHDNVFLLSSTKDTTFLAFRCVQSSMYL